MKIFLIVLLFGFIFFHGMEYYEAKNWKQDGEVFLSNGEKIEGLISWHSPSKLSYKIVSGNAVRVVPKESVAVIAFAIKID